MKSTNYYTIEDLRTKIIIHFRNAIEIYTIKDAINDLDDQDPQLFLIAAEEYRSGLSIIDTLIVDDTFRDKESFDLVFRSIEAYRQFIENDYPMTARKLSLFLSEMNSYRAEVYSH